MGKRKCLTRILAATAVAAVITGCSRDVPGQSATENTETGIHFVLETETRTPQKESGMPEPAVTVGHTLCDGTVTFDDSVAVIMRNYMKKYDPDHNELTLRDDVSMGTEKYAYVYYAGTLSDFLFQRITDITKNHDGTTTITLSGIPLKKELEKEDFNSLIADYNAYGDTTGGEGSEFNENDRPFDDFTY